MASINDLRSDAFSSSTNSVGLIGQNNQYYIMLATDMTTTSTSFSNFMTNTVKLYGGYVVITFVVSYTNSNSSNTNRYALSIDNNIVRYGSGASTNNTNPTTTVIQYATHSLSAGNHTINIVWRVSGGTGRVRTATNPETESANILIQEFAGV